jgi:hypothetical protein
MAYARYCYKELTNASHETVDRIFQREIFGPGSIVNAPYVVTSSRVVN